MKTSRGQWKAAGLLLGVAVLGGVSAARAQSVPTGVGGTGGGTSTTGSVTLNNAPNFDPAAAAAAALVGNYRVPGAAPVDPTGVYRVPIPNTSGGASAATTTTTAATGTTGASGGSTATASSGGASP
jgi:hypothetical protein